ncbi:hypothetical protein DQG13_28975 [Paenibacillus sp. YN15]|nr:hypothetical protein DQG13_28975 [Paenibacillus sp. YN15]
MLFPPEIHEAPLFPLGIHEVFAALLEDSQGSHHLLQGFLRRIIPSEALVVYYPLESGEGSAPV